MYIYDMLTSYLVKEKRESNIVKIFLMRTSGILVGVNMLMLTCGDRGLYEEWWN